MYLVFGDEADLIDHLRNVDWPYIHAELTVKNSIPGEFGVYVASYYAEATSRPGGFGDYIVKSSRLLYQTNSLNLKTEQEQIKQVVFSRFNAFKTELADAGMSILAGRWTNEHPV